ncbi:unannotated protein [freshwater metagenome]|uniref:Unannotated protein n=1 Tax=freshwater metagenome TaxID=449393 RepID=A0A6J7CI41_9ZZZZ
MPSRRLAAVLATIAAIAVAQLAVIVLTPRSGTLEPAAIDLGRYFTPEQLRRASDFRGPQLWLYVATLVAQAAVLALLIVRPGRFGRLLARPWRRPVLVSSAVGAAISVLLAATRLPLEAGARARAAGVGLVNGSWGAWLWDAARSAALGALLAAVATAAAIALMRRLPRGWWAPASGLVVAIAAVLVFAGPLVLDPIFNRFERLPAGPARAEVLALADRAGVDAGEVYVMDASRRTTAANAYVTGFGSSRRIVLYDTLLDEFPPAQRRLVVAHELGHVHYRDVPRALLFILLAAPLGMLAVALLTRLWVPGAAGPRAGPASVPALFAAFWLVLLLLGTVSNQLSRSVEARADTYALRLTGESRAFIGQQRRLALQNVSNPDPSGIVRFLLRTHPTARERIGAGVAWEAGARP